LQRDFAVEPGRCRQTGKELQKVLGGNGIVADYNVARFDMSRALHGALARLELIIDGVLRTPGLGVVVSEQLRLNHLGKLRL
jgi:hypothetical protein